MTTLNDLFSELEASAETRKLPPVDTWQPERTGAIDIVVRANGDWYHEGRRFTRPALVRLLSTVMRRDGDEYFLVTPQEKLAIQVEDVPFLALDFESRQVSGELNVLFTTNGGDVVRLGPEHPIWVEGDRPYIHVRGGLNALVARSAFYRLVELAEEDEDGWHIRCDGQRFALGD